jgi:hypothetical protein
MRVGCPTSSELLAFALAHPDEPVREDIAGHVRECSGCGDEVRSGREAIVALRSVVAVTGASAGTAGIGPCLDELTVASVVDGDLAFAEQPDVMLHLAACARCRGQVASVAQVLGDTAVAVIRERVDRPVASSWSRARPRGGGRWVAAGGAVGGLAAAMIALVLIRNGDNGRPGAGDASVPSPPVHRDHRVVSEPAPRLIAPSGVVASVDTLRWTKVPHAERYRLTLFDRDGNVVHAAQTTDTAIVLPAALALARGRPYLWKVAARTGWDRWEDSELVEFTVAPAEPRKR